MQEIKYTFYLKSDDVETAHAYLERIQKLLLHDENVAALREDIKPVKKTKVDELCATGKIVRLEDGFFAD